MKPLTFSQSRVFVIFALTLAAPPCIKHAQGQISTKRWEDRKIVDSYAGKYVTGEEGDTITFVLSTDVYDRYEGQIKGGGYNAELHFDPNSLEGQLTGDTPDMRNIKKGTIYFNSYIKDGSLFVSYYSLYPHPKFSRKIQFDLNKKQPLEINRVNSAPFDSSLNKLPENYEGQDLEPIFRNLSKEALKDEFETTSDYKLRILNALKQLSNSWTNDSLLAATIDFDKRDELEYDADAQKLHVVKKGGFNFNYYKKIEYADDVTYKPVLSRQTIEYPYRRTYTLTMLSGDDREEFAFDLKMDPQTARRAKSNPKLLFLTSFSSLSPNTKTDDLHEGQRIEVDLRATISEIWLFDGVTGEVYGKYVR